MEPQCTDAVAEALRRAVSLATTARHTEVTENHLLLAFTEDPKGYFCTLLTGFRIDVALLARELKKALASLPSYEAGYEAGGNRPVPDKTLQAILRKGQVIAENRGDSYVGSDHLLCALWEDARDPLKRLREETGIPLREVEEGIKGVRKGRTLDSPSAESSLQAIEKFCKNLTALARQGKLDPVIGRDEEIRRTIQVLSRRTKNNPLLIGEPGVGKTAIAEGLAHRIIREDVPDFLKGKELFALDMGSLIAGTKYRGEFEERFKGIIKEVEAGEGSLLLFIDEVHTLVGAGATEGAGAMDAANLLKPALARGTLHCIGATTLAEYRKYIEKDAALERRFQPVSIAEPSLDTAVAILRGLKERYENYHGVRITEGAIHAAVRLSSRYISDRYLPDKAIDLIDEAAGLIRMQIGSRPLPIDTKERELSTLIVKQEALKREKASQVAEERAALEKEIVRAKEGLGLLSERWKQEKKLIEDLKKSKGTLEALRFQEEEAEQVADYNRVAEIRYHRKPSLEREIREKEELLARKEDRLLQEEVDEKLIAEIVAKWTGIPVHKMLEEEAERLLHLEENLTKRVVGQEVAVQAVSDAVRRSRTGLGDPGRPLGVFLFVGPTGVGKTELAGALAAELFDSEEALTRLDMSEYMEKHAVSKLIGSPPGYIGHEEGGRLTETLRRRPYGVVLLDEIEKAHPDILNILLQIFDAGRITDSKGRTVNCRHALFLMTSNLGAKELLRHIREEGNDPGKGAILRIIDPILKGHFRPEFINRLDDILPFLPLRRQDMEQVVAIQLERVKKRLEEKGISPTWSQNLLTYLAKEGYDPSFGARPLKRVIQSDVINPLATALLEKKLVPGQRVELLFSDKEHGVAFQPR
ncbi:MAG: AAA family ATPase [Simkaniaceae bacterium]|nr:AAA family ATPase [Simkaniaceae bacterium]